MVTMVFFLEVLGCASDKGLIRRFPPWRAQPPCPWIQVCPLHQDVPPFYGAFDKRMFYEIHYDALFYHKHPKGILAELWVRDERYVPIDGVAEYPIYKREPEPEWFRKRTNNGCEEESRSGKQHNCLYSSPGLPKRYAFFFLFDKDLKNLVEARWYRCYEGYTGRRWLKAKGTGKWEVKTEWIGGWGVWVYFWCRMGNYIARGAVFIPVRSLARCLPQPLKHLKRLGVKMSEEKIRELQKYRHPWHSNENW